MGSSCFLLPYLSNTTTTTRESEGEEQEEGEVWGAVQHMLRRERVVSGVLSECVHLPPPPSSSESSVCSVDTKHVVLVPGNPGSLHFYSSWLPTLHSSLEEVFRSSDSLTREHRTDVHLHAFSYANHHLHDEDRDSAEEEENYDLFSLPCQVQHAAAVIRGILKKHQPRANDNDNDNNKKKNSQSLFLISHSLGAYIILDMLNDTANRDLLDKTKHCVFLMPFMAYSNFHFMHKSFLQFLSNSRRCLRWIGTSSVEIYQRIPLSFRRLMLSAILKGQESEYIDKAARGLASHRLVHNILSAVRRRS